MNVLLILYKSSFDIDRVKALFRARASKYRTVAGLRQKLYVHDPATGHVGGIYVFATKDDLDRFRGSDLEKSIAETYQFSERPTFRTLDVVDVLRESDAPLATGAAAVAPHAASHERLFRRVIDEAFNGGDLAALDDAFAPDYAEHQVGIVPASVDAVKNFVRSVRIAFPDLRLTIEEMQSTSDRTWIRTTAAGTHRGVFMGLPPTGKMFSVNRFDVCRFAGERIVEHWGVIDRLAVLQQLGATIQPGQSGASAGPSVAERHA